MTLQIRRTLIGGDVRLPDGRTATVRGINDAGVARVTVHGSYGLDAVLDIPQDLLVSAASDKLLALRGGMA